MTAQQIAASYWQQPATSVRLAKALACATRFRVDPDAVLTAIADQGKSDA